MRFLPRRRDVPVEPAATVDADRDELTLTTYNVWNDPKQVEQRYCAIAELLSARRPDIMVFQEITPTALDVLLSEQWIRDDYARAAVVGGDAGDYGMLMLSRYLYPE